MATSMTPSPPFIAALPSELPAAPAELVRPATFEQLAALPDECIDVGHGRGAHRARRLRRRSTSSALLARLDDAGRAARRRDLASLAARGAGRRHLRASLRHARVPRERAGLLRPAEQPPARRARSTAGHPHHAGPRLLRGRAARGRARARGELSRALPGARRRARARGRAGRRRPVLRRAPSRRGGAREAARARAPRRRRWSLDRAPRAARPRARCSCACSST